MPSKRKMVSWFVIDEAQIKTGSEFFWLRVAVESKTQAILRTKTSKERNMSVAERFLLGIVEEHGKHPVSTDGGTWYPQACRFPKLGHHIHLPYGKSLIERAV